MEKLSNYDSEQVSREKPSISLDGLLSSAALPNLKELFRDEDLGIAAVHILGDKFVIHSELFGEPTKEKLERARAASRMIDESFRQRGVYTWAMTDEQYRYNIFLGYVPTEKEVTLEGVDTPVYEFVKELI